MKFTFSTYRIEILDHTIHVVDLNGATYMANVTPIQSIICKEVVAAMTTPGYRVAINGFIFREIVFHTPTAAFSFQLNEQYGVQHNDFDLISDLVEC